MQGPRDGSLIYAHEGVEALSMCQHTRKLNVVSKWYNVCERVREVMKGVDSIENK